MLLLTTIQVKEKEHESSTKEQLAAKDDEVHSLLEQLGAARQTIGKLEVGGARYRPVLLPCKHASLSQHAPVHVGSSPT
jgi:DNA-binding XRE family transcriptional regulator